jgi:hypothetical protein
MWAAERVILVNVCIVPECVAVFMREVMCWQYSVLTVGVFHGNAILFTISHYQKVTVGSHIIC